MNAFKQSVELAQTSLIPQVVKDYFKQDAFLSDRVNSWHNNLDFERLMQERNYNNEIRSTLANSLQGQYSDAGITAIEFPAVFKNIELLKEEDTFTITTGHQLNLFGGPLYMAYKILTAIKLSSELTSKYPGKKFVPVFWLASEDHDFEEISGCYLFGKNLVWQKESENKATGTLKTDGLEEILEILRQQLQREPYANEIQSLLVNTYVSAAHLAQASLKFYNGLFGSMGLVILDASVPALKSYFKEHMRKDILEQAIYPVQQTANELFETRYELQIPSRQINHFILHPEKGRLLLRFEEGVFKAGKTDITYTTAEIESLIERSPEVFSPNVSMRPVYQETILPNLAYVGGPSEIAYWLQLKPVFDNLNTPFPKLVLRHMQVLLGKGLTEKLNKLGISPADMLLNVDQLSELFLERYKPFDFAAHFEDIINQLQVLVDQSRTLDNALSKAFLDNKLAQKSFFKQKEHDIKKLVLKAGEEGLDKLLKLRGRVYPEGVLQERKEFLTPYLAHSGLEVLKLWEQQVAVFSESILLTEV